MMSIKRRLIWAGLTSILLALQLTAPVAALSYPWIAFRFDVYKGCQPLSKTEQLYFQYGARHIAAVFASRFGHQVRKSEPIRFRLICDEKLFYKFQERHFGKVVGGGYYFKSKDEYEMHLLYRPGDKHLSKGIFHEMTHHILNMRVSSKQPAFPFWFNEGLAGYFGNAQPALHSLRVVISERNKTIDDWVANSRIPSLETFFRIPPEKLANWAYTRDVSESLFHFLMESQQGNQVVAQLILAGYRQKDLETTLATVYPGGMLRLQYDWSNWLRHPRTDHIWSDLP